MLRHRPCLRYLYHHSRDFTRCFCQNIQFCFSAANVCPPAEYFQKRNPWLLSFIFVYFTILGRKKSIEFTSFFFGDNSAFSILRCKNLQYFVFLPFVVPTTKHRKTTPMFKFQFIELFQITTAPSLPLMREVAKIFDFRRRERNIY